ncbi:MAG: hypothetical protein ABR861_02405 [Terriglobales bacterium]|jgi:hypothetical protein
MTKQTSNVLIWAAWIALAVVWSANAGLAADKVNYSGKYSAQARKTASGSETDTILDVVQGADSIEITRVEQGRRTTNRYPLNGSEGSYVSPGGVAGKCKGQLKDKHLVLESIVVARPQPNAPPMRMHTKERWQLSADSKTLTVKSDVDFPDVPGDISALVGAYGSGTQKYTRTENP